MFEVKQTIQFTAWLTKLGDKRAQARISSGVRKISLGLGHVEPVGSGVSELKIHYGPGYRIYHARIEKSAVVLLCGGTKNGQDGDIKEAIRLAEIWRKK